MGAGAGLVAGVTAAFAAADAATVAAIGISLTTVFEITTAVGVGLSVVGAVTKNKVLSDVGLGLGIVGGIGSLAGAAGAFGVQTAASTADAAAGSAGGFAEGLTPATAGTAGGVIDAGGFDASFGGLSSLPPGEAATTAASQAVTNSDGTIQFLANGGADQAPPTDLTTLNTTAENAAGPAAAENPVHTEVADATPDAADAGAMLPGQTETNAIDPVTGQPVGQVEAPPYGTDANGVSVAPQVNPSTNQLAAAKIPGTVTPGVNAAEGTSTVEGDGILSSLLKFGDAHPVVALGALQAGGSFLSGLTSSLTPAQVAAYNAQAANNQAQANLTAQQAANLAMPKAVASSTPVTGTPSPLVPQSQFTGLINNAPKLANVTGVPA